MQETTIMIISRQQDEGTATMEIRTTADKNTTCAILTAAVCGAFGIHNSHAPDVAGFLKALSQEYEKDDNGLAGGPRTLN